MLRQKRIRHVKAVRWVKIKEFAKQNKSVYPFKFNSLFQRIYRDDIASPLGEICFLFCKMRHTAAFCIAVFRLLAKAVWQCVWFYCVAVLCCGVPQSNTFWCCTSGCSENITAKLSRMGSRFNRHDDRVWPEGMTSVYNNIDSKIFLWYDKISKIW